MSLLLQKYYGVNVAFNVDMLERFVVDEDLMRDVKRLSEERVDNIVYDDGKVGGLSHVGGSRQHRVRRRQGRRFDNTTAR